MDRVSRIELHIVDMLLNSDLTEAERDSSVAFELKHQSSVCQLGRIMAKKRGLDIEVAAVGALLHDIAVIAEGNYADHAKRGAVIAADILERTGGFDAAEIATICRLIANHSDKHVYSDDPWIEFGKDVDILDCFLYPRAIDEYFLAKTLPSAKEYLHRAQQVWREFGLPDEPAHHLLDKYTPERWIVGASAVSIDKVDALFAGNKDTTDPFIYAIMPDRLLLGWTGGRPANLPIGEQLKIDEPQVERDLFIYWPILDRHQLLSDPPQKSRLHHQLVERIEHAD